MTRKLYAVGQEKQLPYVDQTRRYGEGDLRIGTTVDLAQDINGLTYIMMMKDGLLMIYADPETGELIPDEEQEQLFAVLQLQPEVFD